MQLPRLADYHLLFLITVTCSTLLPLNADELQIDLESGQKSPQDQNVNADEPQTSLREVESRGHVFRNVSQGVRKPSQDPLVRLCQDAVDTTTRRLLSTDQHTPWQMIHGLLGLRHDFMMQHGDQVVSGLEWIAQGQTFENEHWFEKTIYGGRAHPYSRPYAFEGHANQTIAILSMCGVDLDMEFGTAQGPVTMRQMIEHAKMTIDTEKDEPTWTLWALSRYLPPDARWRNAKGEVWSIERLVQEQTARPLQGAACGGTHGLFALAHARNVYLRQGKQLRGVWLQAEFKIRKYINTARMQQNSNGMLSSNYFRGRQYNPDLNKRMASAGHLLEFLMIALPQEELREQWVRRAIQATAQDLLQNRKAFVKCSPLYHSVNALNIYLDRVNPRSAPETASEDAETRTVMAAPRRLKQNSTELKGVPALGISESRDVASSRNTTPPTAAETGTDQPLIAKTGPVVSGSARTNVTTELPQGLPAVEDTATETETPTRTESPEQTESNRPEGWAATAPKRRTKIDVPEEKVLGARIPPADTEAAATQPVQEDRAPQNSEIGSDATAVPTSKPEAQQDSDRSAASVGPAMETSKAGEPAVEAESAEADADAGPEKERTDHAAPKGSKDSHDTAGTTAADRTSTEAVTQTPVTADSDSKSTSTAESQPNDSLSTTAAGPSAASPGPEPPKTDVQETDGAPTTSEPSLMQMTIPLKSVSSSVSISETFMPDRSAGAGSTSESAGAETEEEPTPSEEIELFSASIVAALEISPGQRVADISAGRDTFLSLLSEAVGETGRVFAIDNSPRQVDLLEQSVEAQQLDNVDVVRSDSRSLILGRQRIDKAIVCDAYRKLEHPRLILASIFNALEAGGEFILIERVSEPQPATSASEPLAPAGPDQFAVRAEIQAAGFEYFQEIRIPGMEHYFLLRFRRPTN